MADGFNSEEYAWTDLNVVMGGRRLGGITGIKWKTKRTVNHIYGKGRDPHARTKGNKEYTGSLKLLQSELEAILESAGTGKDITDLTFNVTVAFVPESGGIIKTHNVINVDVEEFEMGMEQNAPNMIIELPFKAGKIVYNV